MTPPANDSDQHVSDQAMPAQRGPKAPHDVVRPLGARRDGAAATDPVDPGLAERLARRPWPARPLRPLDVSFEFFPANTEAGLRTLVANAAQLAAASPRFVSVTYGAGGSSKGRTFDAIDAVRPVAGGPVAGHLTCVGSSKAEVHDVIDTYKAAGVRRIVALRGDAPVDAVDGGVHPDGYVTAADLVAGIRSRDDGDDWTISVAAYPEVHPKAETAATDLDNLAAKFDAGADEALTQFFFDTDAFLRFHDAVRAHGIGGPIVPGIMPVTNFARMSSFAARCGTVIPGWMTDLFGGLDDTPEVRAMVATTLAVEQCRRLAENGMASVHLYTMNRADLSLAICRLLGVTSGERLAAISGQTA